MNERSFRERRRLQLPPFRSSEVPDLRLACQTRVYEDLAVVKHGGLWGQHVDAVEVEDGDGSDERRSVVRSSDDRVRPVGDPGQSL